MVRPPSDQEHTVSNFDQNKLDSRISELEGSINNLGNNLQKLNLENSTLKELIYYDSGVWVCK
jgi:hypothetical protein